MAFLAPKGILVLSIDLEVDARHSSARDQRLLERLTSRLFDLLVKHRVPATWSVADPAVSAATDRLMTGVGHEIAVLGDPAWVGSDAGRPRFARELERRVQGGREIGLPVTTLALRKVHLDAHLDVVVKNGLNAVRGPETTVRNRNEFNQPQSLYSGLWLMWPSCVLPGPSRWLWGTGTDLASAARTGFGRRASRGLSPYDRRAGARRSGSNSAKGNRASGAPSGTAARPG